LQLIHFCDKYTLAPTHHITTQQCINCLKSSVTSPHNKQLNMINTVKMCIAGFTTQQQQQSGQLCFCLCVRLCVCVCNSIMIQTVEEDFTETSRTRAGLVSNMAEPDTRLIRITRSSCCGLVCYCQ